MASTASELNTLWDKAVNSGDMKELGELVVEKYSRKVDKETCRNREAFIKSMEEFLTKYEVVSAKSETTTSIIIDLDVAEDAPEILSLGTWKAELVNKETLENEQWTSEWSDIRVECDDQLWRLKSTVGTTKRREILKLY